MFSFKLWSQGSGGDFNTETNAFPNIGGIGRDSLAVLHDFMGNMKWAENYRYVPGLRENDPGDLVLMYVDRPTRWIWHGGPAPTIFRKKAWVLVPVDYKLGGRQVQAPGELSEWVPQDEFKRRLSYTIEFVRTNARPNWQVIVSEHTKFLQSIDHNEQ